LRDVLPADEGNSSAPASPPADALQREREIHRDGDVQGEARSDYLMACQVERVEADFVAAPVIAAIDPRVSLWTPQDDERGEPFPLQEERPTTFGVVGMCDLPAMVLGGRANRLRPLR
jgi:hypothetical protein